MAKHYIISISNLVDTFSRALAGKEFDFTISTSESSLSDSTISKDDLLLISVDDAVYYHFNVIDKTEEEIRLKKIFEIEKSIQYNIESEGFIQEITKEEFNNICQKLFSKFNSSGVDHHTIQRNENSRTAPSTLIESDKIREFLFSVFKYVHKEFGDDFLFEKSEIEERKLSDINYEAFIFPDYFKTKSVLGSFREEQSENSLKTSNTLRFFNENLEILNQRYIYFTTQWGFPELQHSSTFISFNQFILDYSKNKYKVNYDDQSELYKLVLNTEQNEIKQIEFDINSFIKTCKAAGLVYSDKLITRFVSSLLTKPFVILTGLSGSGKTKLAQAYVQWICQEESQYRIIPVGADWTNREPLLGYPNALKPEEYVKPDSGVIDLILQANSNPELPHFLILDEMNLSHVERYFADFLSVMESNEYIPLYNEKRKAENGVPPKLKVPKNLFIIGTVNIDETTNMFSPKVLDRANTIEFRINKSEMVGFLDTDNELNMKALLEEDEKTGKGATMAQSFISLSNNKSFTTKDLKTINKTLLSFFGELQKTGAEFGYRSASEILRLINQLDTLDGELSTAIKIDIAIMQKLLPKLHGSRRKLSSILETLGGFCVKDSKIVLDKLRKEDFDFTNEDVLYPLSLEKIARMYKGAIDNGFASYAEA